MAGTPARAPAGTNSHYRRGPAVVRHPGTRNECWWIDGMTLVELTRDYVRAGITPVHVLPRGRT